MSMDYIEEMDVSDIVRIESPVSKKNAQQGFDLLLGVRAIGLLMANQDENNEGLTINRQKDLGSLIYLLTGQPSDVLSELEAQLPDKEDA